MDTYSKAVLTLIAAGVWAIAIKLFIPDIGGSITGAPTFGQFIDLQEDVQDKTKREETRKRLLRNVPVVRVHGGFVDISGSINADK